MESSRRRGRGTGLAGVDGLVTFRVAQLFVNIWGQRNIPYFRKIWLYGLGKFDKTLGTIQHFNNFRSRSIFHLQ